MIEEAKKTGHIRKIIRGLFAVLKWLFVAALSLLLIGGLIFHGPWKVLTLIAIILATLTIVPKPIRKWVWGCFGIIAIVLIIWVFLPDNEEGWKPYTLDEEIAQLEAKYAIPDEENAALIYYRLIETFDANDFRPEFMDDDLEDLTSTQPWSTEDYPQMAEWLKTHEETIATLTEAAAKEKCHFPICINEKEFGEVMNRLGPVKCWAELLIFAINNDIGDGRGNQALEKSIILSQVAQHLCQQTMFIELLVGIAVDGMSMRPFKIFIIEGNPTEAQLDLIEKKLIEGLHDWNVDFRRILESENLFSKNMLLGILYEIDSNGNTRFSNDPTTTLIGQFAFTLPSKRNLLPNYWRKKEFKARTIFAWLWVPTDPQKAAEIIDDDQKDLYAITEDDFDWEKEPELFSYWSTRINFSGMIKMLNSIATPSYHRIHELYLRTTSMNQATRIIVALKRYEKANGAWPESLEDIKEQANENLFVDPTNGGDYAYRLTDDNFTLYSKGENGIDEDGVRKVIYDPNIIEWPTTKPDDILFWPRKSANRG